MKKEIDRLLTEEIPKLIEFSLVASVEVKGQFYMLYSCKTIKNKILNRTINVNFYDIFIYSYI